MLEIISDVDTTVPVASSSSIKSPDNIIPEYIQNQMLTPWNPLDDMTIPAISNLPPSFQGALISNCTFNLNFYNSSPPKQNNKRNRYLFIESNGEE